MVLDVAFGTADMFGTPTNHHYAALGPETTVSTEETCAPSNPLSIRHHSTIFPPPLLWTLVVLASMSLSLAARVTRAPQLVWDSWVCSNSKAFIMD